MGGQAKSKKKNKAKRKDTKPTGGALMSPQERMKAKMQERAKKKTAEKYTIDQLIEKASAFGAAAFPSVCAVSKKDVSVAFCSIAEIFFTDLCMEEGAADRCKEAIDKALQYDEHNPEALQLMASYLFSIEKTEEGREYLKKSVSSWLPSLQKEEESLASTEHDMEEEEDQNKSNIPPYESRITTAKLLIEVEEYEMATEVLEDLLEEDDEVVEVWYLLGWLFYLQLGKQDLTNNGVNFRKSAWTYLSKAKKLYVKLRCEDAPMLEHTEQLLAELGGEEHGADEDDDDEAGPSVDNIEDDFIQSSDEEDDAMDQ
uniref:Si:dkey-12j5.1 n=1 Tax=Cyprinus carpio carpio TaxID=630221 RepID=A0A9J8DFB1_CYPCA